jgi:pimeloyl-ACP methyl ester carboxylesterase
MVPDALRKFGRKDRLQALLQPAYLRVRLPDGRSLAVEEYGDPAGPPVLYFHGWPACRLEGGMIPNLPVRLLAFDRPGYGRSSPSPGRTLLDWPRDVAVVADLLGLKQFHVVGLSGGAPYAAACAYALPDRVLGLALVSPVPPPDRVPRRAPGVGHLFRLGRHPRLAYRLFTLVRPLLRRRIITPRTIVGRNLPEADRAMLNRATLAGLGLVWREGLGRGIQGALSDAQIYARDWGFPLSAIHTPTSLWFGAADSLIPRAALASFDAIAGLRLHILEHEGHYSLALRHSAAVLAELLSPARPPVQLSSSLSQYR